MDPSTIGLIVTSIASVAAACAAAYNTVRKTQIETFKDVISALERRVSDLEVDLSAERSAHQAARAELAQAYEDLQKCRRRRAQSHLA